MPCTTPSASKVSGTSIDLEDGGQRPRRIARTTPSGLVIGERHAPFAHTNAAGSSCGGKPTSGFGRSPSRGSQHSIRRYSPGNRFAARKSASARGLFFEPTTVTCGGSLSSSRSASRIAATEKRRLRAISGVAT